MNGPVTNFPIYAIRMKNKFSIYGPRAGGFLTKVRSWECRIIL